MALFRIVGTIRGHLAILRLSVFSKIGNTSLSATLTILTSAAITSWVLASMAFKANPKLRRDKCS